MAALIAATSAVGLRFAALPRWLGWLGWAIVAAMPAFGPTMAGMAAMVGLLWLLPLSAVLLLRAGRAQPGEDHPAGAAS